MDTMVHVDENIVDNMDIVNNAGVSDIIDDMDIVNSDNVNDCNANAYYKALELYILDHLQPLSVIHPIVYIADTVD
jgi:hypothetical protein